MEVNFHSDESFTDKGFSAEYSAYDPNDRKIILVFLSHIYTTICMMGEVLQHDSDKLSLPLQCQQGE